MSNWRHLSCSSRSVILRRKGIGWLCSAQRMGEERVRGRNWHWRKLMKQNLGMVAMGGYRCQGLTLMRKKSASCCDQEARRVKVGEGCERGAIMKRVAGCHDRGDTLGKPHFLGHGQIPCTSLSASIPSFHTDSAPRLCQTPRALGAAAIGLFVGFGNLLCC